MSRFLQTILDPNDPNLITTMHKLESHTGKAGVDTRLIGEIFAGGHVVMRSLGLDPSDTAPIELYSALSNQANNKQLFANTSYIAVVLDGEVISMNLNDIIANTSRPFDSRQTSEVRRSLAREIITRYSQIAPNTPLLDEIKTKFNTGKISQTALAEKPNYHMVNMLTIGDLSNMTQLDLENDLQSSIENSPSNYSRVLDVQVFGTASDVAVGFAKLGLHSNLATWVGADRFGRRALQNLAGEQVDTKLAQVETALKTNRVYRLRDDDSFVDFVKYQPFEYRWLKPEVAPDWLVMTGISNHSWQYHQDMLEYLEKNPSVKFAFIPHDVHFDWGRHKLSRIFKRADLVIANLDEAKNMTRHNTDDPVELILALHSLGANIAVVTDGQAGAYAYKQARILHVPKYPETSEVVDRSGAGAAFVAAFIASLANNEPLETALLLAPINSASVITARDAQSYLLTNEQLRERLENAPENYSLKEIR